MPVVHTLKTWRQPFQRTWDGNQDYEVRQGDRPFQVGDTLILVEWNEKDNEEMRRQIHATITGITGEYLDTSTNNRRPSGVMEGFVILGIHIIKRMKYVRHQYDWEWETESFVSQWDELVIAKARRKAYWWSFVSFNIVLGLLGLLRWLTK